LRQCSSRYSFRAGRNLPDKEFRYLRTVIVTAAVHRGFNSWLHSPLLLTFRHWAGVSPYTATFVFAETCVFGKQSLEPIYCGPLTLLFKTAKLLGHPFFRRYGVILPSSLTEVRSCTLGVFPRPTGVGVRYGQSQISLAAFLGGLGRSDFRSIARTRACGHAARVGDFPPTHTPKQAAHPVHSMGSLSLPRPRFTLKTICSGAGLSDLLSIAYDYDVLGLGPD
jgi:hypothetical protein